MRKKYLYLTLLLYCLILTTIVIIGSFKKSSNYTGETIQSSLLNEKYKASINSIVLNIPSQIEENTRTEIKLSKTLTDTENNSWTCTIGQDSFLADGKTVENLIDTFCLTRNLILLSKDFSSWHSFGLEEKEGTSISFSERTGGLETLRSKLYFGRRTTDYSGVYVRNDTRPYVYRVEDDISTFLSASLDFWADLSIFRNKQGADEKAFLSIIINLMNAKDEITSKKINNDGKDFFASYIHKLLSLRASGILTKEETAKLSLEKKLELILRDQNSKDYFLSVFTTEPPDSPSCRFFVLYGTDSEMKNTDYLMEISSWTYSNLLPTE